MSNRSLSRRHLFGTAATAVAATTLGVSSAQATTPRDQRRRRLRVVCFNLHHGRGIDGELDLERQAQFFEDQDADVIGLQEVDRHFSERSDWVDQAAWFGERLGMDHAYGANLDRDPLEPGQPRRQYGTAVLSRWPITWWRNTHLPWEEGTEQRGLLEIEIDVDGRTFRFGNTHLQHRPQDADLRLEQARAILDLLGPDPERAFLVGDLNAVPGTPEVKAVEEVLVDAWTVVGRNDPGYTFPADAPDRRIDYVFGSPDARPVRGEVTLTPASDHLPVTVDYIVR